jgi:hypothetical protein
MMKSIKEKKQSFILKVERMLDPVLLKLDKIDLKLGGQNKLDKPAYYRNEDLKKIFGLSNNTIIKYRQTGILPYTKLGEIFLYDSKKIDSILEENKQ